MELLSLELRMQLPMPPIKEPKFYADQYLIRDSFVETLEAVGMKMIRLEINLRKVYLTRYG